MYVFSEGETNESTFDPDVTDIKILPNVSELKSEFNDQIWAEFHIEVHLKKYYTRSVIILRKWL